LQEIAKGKDEYLRLGSGPLKNVTALTINNMYQKAAAFHKLAMRADPNVDLPNVLLSMIRTGKFYPTASWAYLV
jgi:hypothetical protein